MVMVLGAAALMLWPLLWPADPDAVVQLVSGHLIGETSGYVGRVNRDAQTVDVSSSLIGWRPIVLVVNEETSILVQNRQGGFGDLSKDLPVRVSYEIVGDRRLARSIEIVTDEREHSRAAATRAADTAPSGGAKAAARPGVTPLVDAPSAPIPAAPSPGPARAPVEAAPPASVVTPVPVPRAVPDPVAVAKPPAPVVAAPVPRVEPTRPVPPPASLPAPTVSTPRVAAPAPRVEPTRPVPPPASPPAPTVTTPRAAPEASSSVRSAPQPAETDSGDGAAAIDWLLKRR